MEIVYHIGAHCTDEDRIPKCLLKNRVALAEEGIVIPWPRHYRYLFRDLLARLDGIEAGKQVQELILDAVMSQDHPRRVVFSHDAYLGLRSDALGEGRLYPGAERRIAALRKLFPDNPVRFCLAVRNPATFLPALQAAGDPKALLGFGEATDPATLRWSELIGRMAGAVPDARFTVWSNEDSALLWPVVLRAISGHAGDTRLNFLHEFTATLMEPVGLERLRAYLADHPPRSEERRRRVMAAFLGKFGRPDRMEVEIGFPGWTQEYVDALTLAYDTDIQAVAAMDRVTLVT